MFIGLENINPDNLIAAKKRQNKITEYREMLQKWRKHGAITYAGYILGFPADTKESILRDIEIIKRELPLDILEFFMLTPLPGSEDHKVLCENGVWMDPDLNKYDVSHRRHASSEDVGRGMGGGVSRRVAGLLLRRSIGARSCAAPRLSPTRSPEGRVRRRLLEFYVIATVEGVHPLEGGILAAEAAARSSAGHADR